MYESAKLITSSRPQSLGSRLCDFAQIALFSCRFEVGINVVLCKVQLGRQSCSLLIVCRMRHCTLVLAHSERCHLQAYMWQRVNCPLNYDVSNCVYNMSVNFDQIHETLLSVVYLALDSDACFRLDQIPSPHLVLD